MSNIYIKEPPTSGKVLLHTSMGDIDIELWSKEAPIACRNFVQLCMEGYYNGVIFHRIVPNFIVQGGDPTGTGEGGKSVYGKPFKDEFHSRLRFVRRGLVAMANAGPNDNSSQFFFTLSSCTDLNKKHTIFAKVTGDTVYNLVQLGDVETDGSERPINPPCIKWTKVLANPFDDIIPRIREDKKLEEKKKKKKSEMKATKDFKLLSFGEEAEEEEFENKRFDEVHGVASKSSHDLADDPKLSSVPVVEQVVQSKRKREAESNEEENSKRLKSVQEKLKAGSANKTAETSANESFEISTYSDELRKESRRLAREILEARKPKVVDTGDESDATSDEDDESVAPNRDFAEFKKQQKLYRAKTVVAMDKGSSREGDTLAALQRFNEKLHSARNETDGWENDDDEGDDDEGWLLHRLKNEPGARDAKDVNREINEDRYELSDPRNPINKRRRDKSNKGKRSKHRT